MKTLGERVDALEEKVLILERRKEVKEFSNPYKTDSTKEAIGPDLGKK